MDDAQKAKLFSLPIELGEVTPRIDNSPSVYEGDGYDTMAKLIALYDIASTVNHMEFSFEINTRSDDKNDRTRCKNKKFNFGKIALACMVITKQAQERRMVLRFEVDTKKRVVTLEIGA